MNPDQILNEFLRRYFADVDSGGARPLAEYQRGFPEHAGLIADEYQQLCSDVVEPSATASPPAVETDQQQVGRYRLLRLLGRGGQGLIYLAEDTVLRRRVALKLLTELAAITPDALVRFQREALIASRLDDPGICPVYETGTANGVPFIAMRYVEGETLAARIAAARRLPLARPTLDLPAAASSEGGGEATSRGVLLRLVLFAERMARSLHIAHEAGIVHRDIKPGNIMVGTDGTPVLLDFGLARVQDDGLPTLTRTGDLFGTPAYMAPEQLESGVALDRRADVYALGATLYEALTMHRPFELPTRERLYAAIRSEEPPNPRSFNTSVPDDLALILATALAKDRARRYQTALDLAEDLHRWRTGEPILARPPSRSYRIRKFVGRHRALALGSAGVFAALVLGIVGTAVGLVHARRQTSKASSTREFLEWVLVASSPNEQGRDVKMVQVLDEATARLATESLGDDPDVKASLQRVIGQAYQQRGEFAKAEQVLAAALQTCEQVLGEGDPDTVETMSSLCFLHHEQGRLPEAEAVARRALAIARREALTDAAPGVVVGLLNNYGTLLASSQRVDEAQPLIEEAYALALRHLPAEQPAALSAMNNAARLYDKIGRRTEAERIMRGVVEVRRRTLGDDNPKTLMSIDGLAFILHKLQRCDEAQPLFAEALAGFRRRNGEQDLDTLRCMGLMGTCLRDAGKHEQAEPLLRGAAEGLASTQGEPHFETVNARELLALLMVLMGRPLEGEAECRRALAASAGKLRPGMPLRLRLFVTLSRSLTKQQRFEAAEQELQAALAEVQQIEGGGKREIATIERWFGELYEAWGRPVEAAAHRKLADQPNR